MKIYRVEAHGDDWINASYFSTKEKALAEMKKYMTHTTSNASMTVTDFDTEPVEDQILNAWNRDTQDEWERVKIKTEITIED